MAVTARATALPVAVALWATAAALLFAVYVNHDLRPGAAARALGDWPEGSALAHSTEHDTLIMFLHPFCPCSKASVAQLNAVIRQLEHPPSVTFVMVRARGLDDASQSSPLLPLIEQLP